MKKLYLSQLVKLIVAGTAWFSVSTPISASDLQIYAGPGTGGQKTLIMMLDRSGSMGMLADDSGNNSIAEDYAEFRTTDGRTAIYDNCSATGDSGRTKYKNDETYTDLIFPEINYSKNYCLTPTTNTRRYDRLTRLKDGMFALLNSTDPKLEKVYIGMGYYSNNDSISGVLKVKAAPLGKTNSDQRKLLKQQIASIYASASTPTSHAYAEAASYLLGTNTSDIKYLQYNLIERRSHDFGPTVAYRLCEYAFLNNCIKGWGGFIYGEPNLVGYIFSNSSVLQTDWTSKFYYKPTTNSVDMLGGGFANSDSSTKNNLNYNSPLPLNNATCDGQGIYILSDGQPNNTSDFQSSVIAAKALNDATFSCDVSNNIANSSNGSDNGTGWKCMGALAKKLYSGDNVKKRSIQTAFVGFGREFSGAMAENLSLDTRNACQLGSKNAGDVCSYFANDKITVNSSKNYRNGIDGFGKGGFFQVNNVSDVTNSVLRAIENIETGEIEPLSTGSWSVPIDDLNPTGVQPFGYVRIFKPNPGSSDAVWAGNLKKYHVVDGVLSSGLSGGTNIFNTKGEFGPLTSDMWSKTSNDGGDVYRGGAYANIAMPTKSYPNKARKFYTNFGLNSTGDLINDLSKDSSLLRIPTATSNDVTNLNFIFNQFNTDPVIKKFDNTLKRKLINYLGYNLDINNQALPAAETVSLQADDSPWNSFGGISHSLPIQITYSGSLNADGELQATREQSVLFGTMDGGLRLVDASSGQEQFVFIPSDILNDEWQSLGLKKNAFHDNGATQGTDAPWVVDPTYDFEESKDINNQPVTKIKATKVLAYGGLRMGGSSYYGLDLTNSSSPKFKFRIGANQTDYSAMGQSWSKPILANIRIDGKVRRVLAVSGGYDTCYEEPRFQLATNYALDPNKSATFKSNCSNKAKAKGNAVYLVDAETGERVFWVSNVGADINNDKMVHSIVSDISTVDTDADGLIDHLYFGDLGGQVFRVDLNNLNKSTYSQSFGVRAVRIADLATDIAGLKIPLGDNPRFYEAPTLTMHREQGKKFLLIGMVSGDRSSPLDVAPIGNDRPSNLGTALAARPTNKVYGIIDTDAMKSDLNTNYSASLDIKDITLDKLVLNPQVVVSTTGFNMLLSRLYPYASSANLLKNYGWYRSLSSNANGVERSTLTGAFRKSGGIKAFEAPIAIKNTLVVSTYDPESQSLGEQDPCQVRVIGETFRQYYCLPFGVCLKAGTNAIDTQAEKETGWKPAKASEQIAGETIRVAQGKGILGNALVDKPDSSGNCGGVQLGGNTIGTGEWACISQTKSMNWFEK